jgi:nucleoside-diphosphate-sugar epimerase
MPPYVILGAGYTGARVAARLAARGLPVRALRSADTAATPLAELIPENAIVLHSVPSLENNADAHLLTGLPIHRVVYLSTTGVYGNTIDIDENTPPQPADGRARARLATEQAIQSGPWQTLILRPAAIYGPDRGAHVSLREGRYRLPGDGSQFISRIHVDDLAALAAAALLSDLQGAFPVADDHPCPSLEIAQWCAGKLGLSLPPAAPLDAVERTRRSNRRVDGRAIRRLLGVELQYPSYREGIGAAV